MSLSKVFDQYLRTTKIPVLEYQLEGSRLSYRWSNVVPGFDMPVKATTSPGTLTLDPADGKLEDNSDTPCPA